MFTSASTAFRGLTTGQWPTGRQFAEQAGMDMLTFGILRGAQGAVALGGRIVGRTAPPIVAHGATFSALWAWTSYLTIRQANPADIKETLRIIGRTGVHTLVDYAVIHHAVRIATIPSARTLTLSREVFDSWQTLERRATDLGNQIRDWAGRTRARVELEVLLRTGMGITNEAIAMYGRMRAANNLSEAEATALQTEARQQLVELETLREGATLGIDQVSESVYRYEGSVGNAEHYLLRLQRSGTVSEVARQGGEGAAGRRPHGPQRRRVGDLVLSAGRSGRPARNRRTRRTGTGARFRRRCREPQRT